MDATEPSVQNIWLEDELRCVSSYSGHLNETEVIVNVENLGNFLPIFKFLFVFLS